MPAGFLIEVLTGIVLASAVIYLYRRAAGTGSMKRFFAVALFIVAAIYVGFAVIGLILGSAGVYWLLIELGGVLIYSIFAYLGYRKTAGFLAFGWAAHVIWDVWLHWGDKVEFVPSFYPNLCIGFDLFFAGYIVYKFFIVKRN